MTKKGEIIIIKWDLQTIPPKQNGTIGEKNTYDIYDNNITPMMRSMMIVTTQDDTLSHLANGTLKKKFELYFPY